MWWECSVYIRLHGAGCEFWRKHVHFLYNFDICWLLGSQCHSSVLCLVLTHSSLSIRDLRTAEIHQHRTQNNTYRRRQTTKNTQTNIINTKMNVNTYSILDQTPVSTAFRFPRRHKQLLIVMVLIMTIIHVLSSTYRRALRSATMMLGFRDRFSLIVCNSLEKVRARRWTSSSR